MTTTTKTETGHVCGETFALRRRDDGLQAVSSIRRGADHDRYLDAAYRAMADIDEVADDCAAAGCFRWTFAAKYSRTILNRLIDVESHPYDPTAGIAGAV